MALDSLCFKQSILQNTAPSHAFSPNSLDFDSLSGYELV